MINILFFEVKIMQGRYFALAVLAAVIGVSAGIYTERFVLSDNMEMAEGPEILYWVAPMDPNFRKDGPGKSPMGMDLVPVFEGDQGSVDPEEIQIDAREINAIGVRTATARVEQISTEIETVGFIGFDEHKTSHVHLRVEGWIEELKIGSVGDKVKKGDLLFKLYAPEITIASSELIRGVKRKSSREIDAATRKLKNYGVSKSQIKRMASAPEPAEYLEVYAPQDGIITDLTAVEGMYLRPDIRALSLTDLSSVWLLVDVFERDIQKISKTMIAKAKFDHMPGQEFVGEVDYIYPELDAMTRTLPVRLKFKNSDGSLKPNMFGAVKLISDKSRRAITVPAEAVIRTGRAERIILKTGEGTFRPRLVTTGMRESFGDNTRTEILQGLQLGEEVVTSAQFLIDSESSLSGGMLRMAPTKEVPANGKGILIAKNEKNGTIIIDHEEITSLDWPSMESTFALSKEVNLASLEVGQPVQFAVVRGSDNLLSIQEIRDDNGVEAEGTGVIHAVTAEGKINISHDPIPELGWPSMTMDLDIANVDPSKIPLDTQISFDLVKDANGMFAVSNITTNEVPIDSEKMEMASMEPMTHSSMSEPAGLIQTTGVVNDLDIQANTANITHGPLSDMGMPGMTMDFSISESLDLETIPLNKEIIIYLERRDDFSLLLKKFEEAS
ncbi:efflux RND transporter periplasmic adaptor subunit [Curvivirga sp.]|uniref:efflux RND transporter periplasmic adaptor subunit n=1 Tax=Curvivirga sp. TaxID=2856848 RepID=UPI003B5B4E95